MTTAPPHYRRLPGRGAGLARYTSLYLGPDHLLQVTSTGFSETYRRFYFRDIHAVSVVRTSSGRAASIVMGTFALVSALFMTLFTDMNSPGGQMGVGLCGAIAGCCALGFLVNLLAGPTCRCQVATGVQSERLSSLGRLHKALKVVRLIEPLIDSAQAADFSSPHAAAPRESPATGPPGGTPDAGLGPTME